jgi:ADP-ribosylglycohydrolase
LTAQALALDRARAALWGGALGDAMGMPSQTLPRAVIAERYGRIAGFIAPHDGHPISHGLSAAQVTDDTEQTLVLAHCLLLGFDEMVWAQALLAWESTIVARGLHDLLGPSSKAALRALLGGVPPGQSGLGGRTNGAAMRIAPVGIATASTDADRLARAVFAVSRITHATAEAVSAASAVAAVISAGIDGASFDEALGFALAAADAGARVGLDGAKTDVAARIRLALTAKDEDALAAMGTSVVSRESVPVAFGVVRLAGGDPWRAALIAANIGDDTDTIGAIACAMAGACGGMATLPVAALDQLRAANDLEIDALAGGLLALRAGSGSAT